MNNRESEGGSKRDFKRKLGFVILIPTALMFVFGTFSAVGGYTQENEPEPVHMSVQQAEVTKIALISAAVAFGFGAIGAGIAIANVGAAAMGAIGEKPEIAPQALIFIALAEGLAVFGFITALMILGRV
jgi:V/A-type H+-transporting ATPase subunit K